MGKRTSSRGKIKGRKYKKGIKSREVGKHVATQIYLWSETIVGGAAPESVTKIITKEWQEFQSYYDKAIDALDKLEGLLLGKITEKPRIYRDKVIWGIDGALPALRKLKKAIGDFDILGPSFDEDISVLENLE